MTINYIIKFYPRMFQFKLKSVFSFAKNDPNPWVLSQYASERNTKTFLPAEQYKSCFNSQKVLVQLSLSLVDIQEVI